MFGDGRWGGSFVSTPSAGRGNISRIACASVTLYGLLLQGRVTYHEGKSKAFVMIFLYDKFVLR